MSFMSPILSFMNASPSFGQAFMSLMNVFPSFMNPSPGLGKRS
jgi:hypothetical protein